MIGIKKCLVFCSMIKIIYPPQKPAIKMVDGKEFIFCCVRKKWLVLTPEEWVRQNFILSLTGYFKYPASLIAVEKRIKFHEVNKRFDIVVYNQQTTPFMLVECKEMNVPLQETTFYQALLYNTTLQAPYFLITNGTSCMGFKKIENSFRQIFEMPASTELKGK